jgi:hypothetical protein
MGRCVQCNTWGPSYSECIQCGEDTGCIFIPTTNLPHYEDPNTSYYTHNEDGINSRQDNVFDHIYFTVTFMQTTIHKYPYHLMTIVCPSLQKQHTPHLTLTSTHLFIPFHHQQCNLIKSNPK